MLIEDGRIALDVHVALPRARRGDGDPATAALRAPILDEV